MADIQPETSIAPLSVAVGDPPPPPLIALEPLDVRDGSNGDPHRSPLVAPKSPDVRSGQNGDDIPPALFATYSMCRDRVRSENELTNHRLSWNFAIQGFLFGSYALCVQKIVDLQIRLTEAGLSNASRELLQGAMTDLRSAIWYLGMAGEFVSGFILLGAVAAQIAIIAINRKWHQRYPEYRCRFRGEWKNRKWNTHGAHLPGMLGGGNVFAHSLGLAAPLIIPLVFILTWIFLVRSAYHI